MVDMKDSAPVWLNVSAAMPWAVVNTYARAGLVLTAGKETKISPFQQADSNQRAATEM